MNRQMAIKTLRDHLSESSTHKWKLIEKAIDTLEKDDLVDKSYYSRIDTFVSQIDGVINDFYHPLRN